MIESIIILYIVAMIIVVPIHIFYGMVRGRYFMFTYKWKSVLWISKIWIVLLNIICLPIIVVDLMFFGLFSLFIDEDEE